MKHKSKSQGVNENPKGFSMPLKSKRFQGTLPLTLAIPKGILSRKGEKQFETLICHNKKCGHEIDLGKESYWIGEHGYEYCTNCKPK